MKKKLGFFSNGINDTDNYLTGMLALCVNSLQYFDNYYIEKKYISYRDLKEIKALELNINLLEFNILKIMQQQAGSRRKAASPSSAYAGYTADNLEILSKDLFLANEPGDRKKAIKKIQALNNYFIDEPAVQHLVKERNALLIKLEALDLFNTEETIMLRYKRIFLQRRLTVYSYCSTEVNVYINKFGIKTREVALLTDELKALLELQKDFAVFEFENIFEKIAKVPGPLKAAKQLQNTEDVDALKKQLAEKDKKFNNNYIKNSTINDTQAAEYQQYLTERDALKYLIDQKTKALDYGDQFVQNAKDQSFKNVSKDFGKMVLADIGSTVAMSLWKTINGKTDEIDWGATAKKIGVAIAEAGIMAISNAFFGGIISSSAVKSIFSAYHPVPQSPELLAIGEVKKILENVEKKIDQLAAQVSLFETKITAMIDGLPEQFAAKLKAQEINVAVNEVLHLVRNAKLYSERIIKGGSCSKAEFEILESFDVKARQKTALLISKLYGEVNLLDPAGANVYLLSTQPKKDTLLYDLIACTHNESFFRDFYTTYHEVQEVIEKVTDDLFEAYNFTRPLVVHALSICFVTHYIGADEVKQESIVSNLQSWAKEDEAINAMLYTIKGDLKHYVLGDNNSYLVKKISEYRNNPDAFNFTKSFYLEVLKSADSWQPVYYDYADDQPKFKSGGGYKEFLLTPNSFVNKNSAYELYNVNSLFSIENFSKKMALGFGDQVYFVGEENEFRHARVIAPSNSNFSSQWSYCFATGYDQEQKPGDKKTVQLPVSGMQLEFYSVKEQATGYWEYRVDLVNANKERATFCRQQFRYADTRIIRLFFNANIPSIELNVYDKSDGHFMGSLTRLGFQSLAHKLPKLSSFCYVNVGEMNNNYKVDNKFAFAYVPLPENTNKLMPGQKMCFGDQVISTRERYQLNFQPDGNLVLYAKYAASTGNAYWSSDTHNEGVLAMLLGNNCLIIYDRQGKTIFKSSVLKNLEPGGYLEMQEDRNIVIYSKRNQALWSSRTQKTDFNTVDRGEFLLKGEKLTSEEDNRVTFEFQDDTNLVIYFTKSGKRKVLWANGFIKNADKFVVTGEACVQVLDKNGTVLKSFADRKHGPRCHVKMQTHFAIGIVSNYYLKLQGPGMHRDLVAGTY